MTRQSSEVFSGGLGTVTVHCVSTDTFLDDLQSQT